MLPNELDKGRSLIEILHCLGDHFPSRTYISRVRTRGSILPRTHGADLPWKVPRFVAKRSVVNRNPSLCVRRKSWRSVHLHAFYGAALLFSTISVSFGLPNKITCDYVRLRLHSNQAPFPFDFDKFSLKIAHRSKAAPSSICTEYVSSFSAQSVLSCLAFAAEDATNSTWRHMHTLQSTHRFTLPHDFRP